MQICQKFSLGEIDSQNGTSLLMADNIPLNIRVDGTILEAQFTLDDGDSLIWLTENSPYDEGLHIYLLGRADEIQDALEAGAVFAAGILEIISEKENTVIFKFFKNLIKYKLTVENQPRVNFFLTTGWKYKSLLQKHRLIVEESKN